MNLPRHVGNIVTLATLLSLVGTSVPWDVRAYHSEEELLLDDTAYSLRRREARLGIMQLGYGIIDQLQVTTYVFPWILGAAFETVAPNLELKSTLYQRRRLALSLSAGFVTGEVTQDDEANSRVRYFLFPMSLTASVRANHVLSVHTGGKYVRTHLAGDTSPEGTDVKGALLLDVMQLWVELEMRLSHTTAFTLTGRVVPYAGDSVLQANTGLDEFTTAILSLEVNPEDVQDAWAVVAGVALSWDQVNLILGLGYGDLFLPGVGLVVPGPFPVPVLDFYVRF